MKAPEASNDVIKGLQKAAREAKASGKARGALLIVFEKNSIVLQQVMGQFDLFMAVGAVDVLKNDLINQADQAKQGDIL